MHMVIAVRQALLDYKSHLESCKMVQLSDKNEKIFNYPAKRSTGSSFINYKKC